MRNAPNQGLEIFDVKIEERPIRLGGIKTDGLVRGLDVSGALAFLATDQFGLVSIDVSHPEAAFQVGRGITAGLATGVRVEQTHAFVSVTNPQAGPGYVQEFDVGLPMPALVSTVPLDADPLALELGPNRFYTLTTADVADEKSGGLFLSIYDRTGARLSRTSVVGGIQGYEQLVRSRLLVRSGRAYVTVGAKLYVYDLSNEAAPVALQAADLGATASGLAFAGGALFATTEGDATAVQVPPSELLLVELEPANGSVAAATTPIRASFTLPVAPDSLTDQTFRVTANDGTGWRTVAGTREVLFAVHGSTAVFTPDEPFHPGEQVQVELVGLHAFDTRPLGASVLATFEIAEDGALQPVISSIEPSAGLVEATTGVVISGAGFRDGDEVRVAGELATVVSTSATALEVLVPPSVGAVAGAAVVEVIDPGGLRAVRLGGFVYREPLRLLSLAPDRAPQQGGVEVELRGRGFAPGMEVFFGETRSFTVRATSPDRATAVAPPGFAGLVAVRVALPGQTHSLPNAFLYGSGAVAKLPTPPIAHVLVDRGVAYAALGGETAIVGVDGKVYAERRATQTGGVLIADLSEPTAIREIKRLPFGGDGGVRRLAKQGDLLFVAAGTGGVAVVNVALPGAPVTVATLPATGAAVDVAVADDVLFVADGAGISSYRLGETPAPLRVGGRAFTGGVSALALHRGMLLAASADPADPRLFVLDARRADLSPFGSISLAAPGRHIAAEGTRAFVALGKARQVAVIQLADPAAPAPAGDLLLTDPLGGDWLSAEQTMIAGEIAYVAAGEGSCSASRFATANSRACSSVRR